MKEESYIKFVPKWKNENVVIDLELIEEINTIRTLLIKKNWLGVLSNGIGFGNISKRSENSNEFIISGSATGKLAILESKHLAIVKSVDIPNNSLICYGLTIASAESMSHAVFYNHGKKIRAVIHIHCSELWNKYVDSDNTSDISAEYGTPEMANSLKEKIDSSESGFVIMGGHKNGIIAYGDNLSGVLKLLNDL